LNFVRKPFDILSRDQSVARAQIQADEDRKIFDVMDELFDPTCKVCRRKASVGAADGCPHCSMWEVMKL
jgi:hypothetical protein